MRHARILMLGASLCLLAACGGFNSGDIAPPPAPVVVPCAQPVQLPDGAMTQAGVEVAWGTDRAALRTCGERHGLLVDWAQGQMGAG